MASDTSFGEVRKFEDFLVTAIADLPEIDVYGVTGSTIAVVDGGLDGRLRLDMGVSNDDDVAAVSFGALNWTAGNAPMRMEARIILSAITDNKFFVGFGDSIASADETTFSMTTDTVTLDTMSDAIGIGYDKDASTDQLWAVAGKTDTVTVEKGLGSDYNPVAATPTTLGVSLSLDRKSAQFFVDGKEVHRIDSATTLIAAVDLVPGVWAYEQATAFNLDVDYIFGAKGRSTT